MKYFIIAFLIIGIENCMAQNIFDYSEKNVEKISLIQLIANPEKYDGKVIEVQGFLSLEFEGQALYLQKDDYEYLNWKNGVSVLVSISDDQKKDCHLKFVSVVGKFLLKIPGGSTYWCGWLITKNIQPSLNRKQLREN